MHPAEVAMRRWIEAMVIGLDLCPFARRVVRAEQVRYVMLEGTSLEALAAVAHEEMMELAEDAEGYETVLILGPNFNDFEGFLDGVALLDGLVEDLELSGVIQVAHFHPAYRFGPEAQVGDYTNRAPVAAWHLLREADVEAAVAAHPDAEGIPSRNVARLEALGWEAVRRLAGTDEA